MAVDPPSVFPRGPTQKNNSQSQSYTLNASVQAGGGGGDKLGTRTASFATEHTLLGRSHVGPIQVGTDRRVEHVGCGRSQTRLLFAAGTRFDYGHRQVGLFAQP